MRRPRSGQFARLLHLTSANVNKANCATKMPTSVLSKNTWGRNVRTTARFLGLSLFAGLDSVFSELRGVGALPAPAAGAGCDLGVGDISDSPLLLLSALLHAVVDGLTAFAFFGAALFVAFPARLLFHFFLLPFLVLGLVDLVP